MNMRVCVIGLWHLGSVTSACLADLGYYVVGLDRDESVIQNLKHCKAPIYEPGLDDMIQKNSENGHLQFTVNSRDAISDSDYILLTIDTPVDDNDKVDLSSVYATIDEIASYITNGTTIIVQSQVPVGTCEDFIARIKQKRPDIEFGLAYCPENLRLGKAIDIFKKPDRIIAGTSNEQTAQKINDFFSVLNCPIIHMDLRSAEMTKHSINAFLATCISFINWIGTICEEVGADSKKVSEGLMSEHRIGRNLPLRSGFGFSGGTLGRDLRILEKFGNQFGVKPNLMESILEINHQQNISIVKKLLKKFTTLNDLIVSIFGLTYKPGTNTLRRSASIEIINELLRLGAKVNAYDPSIQSVNEITNERFRLFQSAHSATEGASALLIVTDWPEFNELDYEKIFSVMKKPIIFDMKNFLDEDRLRKLGFIYHRT